MTVIRFLSQTLMMMVVGLGGLAAASVQAQGRQDGSQMLERADLNGDGRITREESRKARAQTFDRLDRDGDGVVSKADAPRGLMGRSAADRFDTVIARMDANRDGRVTREEFVDGPAPAFDRADSNRDGVIDEAELSASRRAAAARRQ